MLEGRLARLAARWATYWPEADVEAMAADVLARVEAARRAWGLDGLVPFAGGDVALVAAAGDAVLKVGPRGHADEPLMAAEGEALAFWTPTGAVPRLLGGRDGGLTLLLERVRPGDTLDESGAPFEERLSILGGLARRLHRAGRPLARVPHIAAYARDWRATFAAADPAALAELDALLAPGPDDVVVHADLHGANALRDARGGWRAIDPHAVRGDRHADVWALIDPLVPALPEDEAAAVAVAGRWLTRYCGAAGLEPGRAAAWVRLRARAEALAIDARAESATPEDRAWAVRLHRAARAFAGSAGAVAGKA